MLWFRLLHQALICRKDIFQSKHEKKPKPLMGLDGIYSLKRLAEA
jgi:hypothetical protein